VLLSRIDNVAMAHTFDTFDSARFGELAGDEQLASGASDHGRRLASLVNAFEPFRGQDG